MCLSLLCIHTAIHACMHICLYRCMCYCIHTFMLAYSHEFPPTDCFYMQPDFFLNKLFIYLFIYLWLHWVFVAVRGLSLVAVSRGYSSLRCTGFSLRWLLLLQSTGCRRAGSVVVAHGLSGFAACGIFPDQGSNLCALHWQADS